MNNSASVWHRLAAAPHHGMFLAGALQGAFTLLWWVLDLARRHDIALAIGYFANMVLGMASRVTLGHSGNLLVLDKFTWRLFIGFRP